MKRAVEIKSESLGGAIVSNTVKSHASDPVVIKKAEEAKAFFKKAGFPKGELSTFNHGTRG
ncbi:hypothetical protein [Mucilaginibacter sp.]|uniref:hypothetical protein n=1 Tax=Mucilaginibacter sp. TaxID=1882438 RepID=UPI00284F5B9B|nr:hypothetical protein [Mucilaginibacter sp.]MDR3695155.1 hypothetical protein [Mucilaginibacter sp.]